MPRIEAVYERLLGPGAERGRLTAGFQLLLAGTLLGLAGLALFFVAEAQSGQEAMVQWRKAAIALAAVAAPMVFLGISTALPGRWLLRGVAVTGSLLCVATVGLFIGHYPEHFNHRDPARPDYAALDASLFILGLTVLVAGILAQLIGVYLRRVEHAGDGTDPFQDPDYEVPDWVVQRDIDEAMRINPVAWGDAVGHRPPDIQIKVNDALEPGSVVSGRGVARRVSLKSPQVESKSRNLRGLRSDTVEMPATPAERSTQALMELNRRKAADPKAFRVPRRRWWHRMVRRMREWRGRHGRLRHARREKP